MSFLNLKEPRQVKTEIKPVPERKQVKIGKTLQSCFWTAFKGSMQA